MATGHARAMGSSRHSALQVGEQFERHVNVASAAERPGDAPGYGGRFIEVRLGPVLRDQVQGGANPSCRDPGVVDRLDGAIAHCRHQRHQRARIV